MSFTGGLHHVAGRCYAWLQPDGGWGLSNAGLIVGEGAAVLVDTLFDLVHTRRMLDAMDKLTARAPIATAINTHGNGDHWFGNELIPDAEIIAAAGSLLDMQAVGPATVASLVGMPGPTGDYVRNIFGRFRFDGISPAYPSTTFEGARTLEIGGVELRLIDVGPAHTRGDTIVHCPQDRVVYTGDIVFAGGTPLVWAGPVANWIAACDTIAGLDVDVLVPGHGPPCPVATVRDMADYLSFVHEQALDRHAKGMTAMEAALTIDLGRFGVLPERERLALNVSTIYRELDPPAGPPDGPAMFGCMAELLARDTATDTTSDAVADLSDGA